jgi:preprotein translocase subunit SecB
MTNDNTEFNPAHQLVINAQYVKDLSFESPSAPMSLTIKTQPKIDISLNLEVKNLQQDSFEVSIAITAKATNDEGNLFLVELNYAGIFTIMNIPDEQKEMILLVYCPSILFPFARRIIADATRDGGFQPLMIDPIDFATLYHKRNTEVAPSNDTIN